MNNSMKFIWDQTFLSEMLNRASICNLVSSFFCVCIFLFSFWYPVCWLCVHVLLRPPPNMRFCLTSSSCLKNLTERKGLTVTSTSRHVNQSKNYNDDLQAGVLRTEVEEPSIGEKLLLAGLETCDKVGEERVTLAARW